MPQAYARYKIITKSPPPTGLALVAVGANQPSRVGSPAATLQAAFQDIGDSGLKICEQSRLFTSPCFPAGAGPDYVNGALSLRTQDTATDILATLHRIEAKYGRTRSTRWGQRVLDLDLIALDDAVYPDPETYQFWCDLPLAEQMSRAPDGLILPHPRMQERAFVLVPLAEVAPDWRHPVSGETVRQMCDALPESEKSALSPL